MTIVYAILLVLISAGVASALTPLVARVARTLDIVDRPNVRKVSDRADMPLLGGIAVALGTVVGLAAAMQLDLRMKEIFTYFDGFLIGGSLMLLIGALDDRFGLTAAPKLAVQVLAAGVAIFYGVRIEEFREPISGLEFTIPFYLSWTLTTLWIVGVTNAMNLIDGLDGEAAGIGAIIALTLTVICWQTGQWTGVALGLVLFGALLGFLPFNFPPARIFLGDTGALFIGFTLAFLALEGYVGGHRKAALLTFAVPLLALAVPILDTMLSIYRRIRSGQPVFRADDRHMHHRLLAIRGSPRMAVLSLYFLTACFCIIAVSFSQLRGYGAFIFLAAVVALTFRLLSNLGFFAIEAAHGAENVADTDGSETPGSEEGADR